MTHRHLAIATHFIVFIVYVGCYAQKQPAETDAQQWGFKGPIRSVKGYSQVLNPDPRSAKPSAGTADTTSWQLFSVSGYELERGDLDDQRNPVNVRRFEADPARNMVITTVGGKKSAEADRGPFGATEERVFEGDRVRFRTTITYDDLGEEIEVRSFDDGLLDLVTKHRYGTNDDEYWVWGRDDQFLEHRLSRYDEDGDLVEQTDYNARDEAVITFRLHKADLIYLWRNPACRCGSSVRVEFPEKATITSYTVDHDGHFEKKIEHYKTGSTFDVSDLEIYDMKGDLIERVTFDYQDDGHGNWITCVTSVRDLSTGAMVPVAKDVRTLTYYGNN